MCCEDKEELTVAQRTRSRDKDIDAFQALHGILATLDWLEHRNQVPYANDLSFALNTAMQYVERAMEYCNMGDDELVDLADLSAVVPDGARIASDDGRGQAKLTDLRTDRSYPLG